MDSTSKRKYALFSNATYKYPHVKEYLNNFNETRAYKYMSSYSSQYGLVLRNKKEIVLAIRGTDPNNIGDLTADAFASFGVTKYSRRYAKAEYILRKLKNRYPRLKITVTGHSLGGTIASELFEKFKKVELGFFYNPAPLESISNSPIISAFNNYFSSSKKGGYVYLVALDPLSAWNTYSKKHTVFVQEWNPRKGSPHSMHQFL